MVKYTLIIEYLSKGNNFSQVATLCGCSRTTVWQVLQRIDFLNISLDEINEMQEEELRFLLFPERIKKGNGYLIPDFKWEEFQMRKHQSSLRLCWRRYCKRALKQNLKAYSWASFVFFYGQFRKPCSDEDDPKDKVRNKLKHYNLMLSYCNPNGEQYEASNPQIDSERTRNNYRFTPHFGKTYTEFINGRIKELGLSPRKDAVVMNSFVLGSDKQFFDGLAKVEQYNFFSDCYQFFAERYGEENIIAAVVHNDETTPHMHLNLMPVTKDGRLCSKQLFDKPQLQKLQTDFYETVGKRWGLQRGKEGSQKKHLSTAEFKAKKIIEQAEAIKQENQVYADALEEAKGGEIPRKRGRLQEQVIALTAENKDLTARLDKSMGETLEHVRKAETLQKEKDKNEKYVHAGKTLARIAPNTYRGITYGMGSVGLFFSAFADFCTPSVQRQIPLLQKIEQEMKEEKEKEEREAGQNNNRWQNSK